MAAATDILNHARGIARAGGHHNIVTVHALTSIRHPETGELVDTVVMEWLDGDSLASKLHGAITECCVRREVEEGGVLGEKGVLPTNFFPRSTPPCRKLTDRMFACQSRPGMF